MDYADIVKFHGHECPGLASGYRMSLAAMAALGADTARDEELVAIVENDACGVDALQMVSGCTFGKGNLVFRDHGKQVYTLFSRSSGRSVRVLFHGRGMPSELKDDRIARAAWILAAPEDTIISTGPALLELPAAARVSSSAPCPICGEPVMEGRLRQVDGQVGCIPCAGEQPARSDPGPYGNHADCTGVKSSLRGDNGPGILKSEGGLVYEECYEQKMTGAEPLPFALPGWIACAPFEEYLGMRIEAAAGGKATLTMPFLVKHAQGKGVMHGGAVTALADTAVAMAAKSLLPEGTHFVTAEFCLTFHAPVLAGPVRAEAEASRRDERNLDGIAVVYAADGTKVATFTSRFRVKRG